METFPVQKLCFEPIDGIVNDWVDQYGLTLIKEYKGVEVRSVYLTDSTASRRVQIWIDPLEDSRSAINVWEIARHRRDDRPPTLIPANKET